MVISEEMIYTTERKVIIKRKAHYVGSDANIVVRNILTLLRLNVKRFKIGPSVRFSIATFAAREKIFVVHINPALLF